ncbi:hypothetical protein T440DRAFT_521568 [Plenodomus tracheiphilus IPT5]|uniref:DUF6590 domain-containing protein n=1 Tax=Plenodomus tracheiphilus IPT5 TaxID=1408161 RepID=A0A6A7AU36_9PLEO|nr:hypothetical protein T440DRAFT_521568 [Plenodomus tracheiphilus IPT5]
MASNTTWIFDQDRQSHYYYDDTRDVYVYENGNEIENPVSVRGQGAENTQITPAAFPFTQQSYTANSNFLARLSNLNIGNAASGSGALPNRSVSYDTSGYIASPVPGSFGLTEGYTTSLPHGSGSNWNGQAHTQPGSTYAVAYTSPVTGQPSGPAITRPSDAELLRQVSREVVLDPNDQDTPADFPSSSKAPHPHRILRGSEGRRERLKPSFKILTPGSTYFKRGFVFRILWPELAGDQAQNMTIASKFLDENIFCKIRWFVVVREGHDCCTCLSIQTYGGRGVPPQKPNSHHAIIYTGLEPPPTRSEQSSLELPLGESIRVLANKQYEKMDPMSRVNFLKLYTIEHNVKVESFGYVDPNEEYKLNTQFNMHWGIPGPGALPPATRPRHFHGTNHEPTPPARYSDQAEYYPTDSLQAESFYSGSSYVWPSYNATSYQTSHQPSAAMPTIGEYRMQVSSDQVYEQPHQNTYGSHIYSGHDHVLPGASQSGFGNSSTVEYGDGRQSRSRTRRSQTDSNTSE